MLLAEASHGGLQQYLDGHNASRQLRHIWFRQATESIDYIHSRGVVHSDLRPDNFLVHETSPGTLSLLLCDFGGSICTELDLDGEGLPDPGFSEPDVWDTPTTVTDLFSLGSVLYTIITGHWPHRTPGGLFRSREEMDEYEAHVSDLFRKHEFPKVDDLFGGDIMARCWTKKYTTATEALQDVKGWCSYIPHT